MRILQRYILRHLVASFVLTFTVVTAVFFVAGWVATIYRQEAFDLLTFLRVTPQLVIYSTFVTIPMSALVAVVLTYGRLSADNEFTAAVMGGIHPHHLFSPALLIGLTLSLGNLQVNNRIIPRARFMRDEILESGMVRFIENIKGEERNIRMGRLVISFDRHDPRRPGHFEGLWILLEDKDKKGLPYANYQVSAESGRIYHQRDERTGELKICFEVRNVVGVYDGRESRAPVGHTCLSFREIFGGSGERAVKERTPEELLVMARTGGDGRRDPLVFVREWHRRVSWAFACLVFILVGAPVGVMLRRGGLIPALFVSCLVVAVVYFPLCLLGDSMSKSGDVRPEVGMWLADGVTGLVGVVLWVRMLRR